MSSHGSCDKTIINEEAKDTSRMLDVALERENKGGELSCWHSCSCCDVCSVACVGLVLHLLQLL